MLLDSFFHPTFRFGEPIQQYGLTVTTGSERDDTIIRSDVPRIVDWYMEGKIAIDPMITHVLTLEEINKGFDLMHAGESIRSVVVY